VRQNAFSALLEKKPESCAVLKIDLFGRVSQEKKFENA
jgi:hypothetical protein